MSKLLDLFTDAKQLFNLATIYRTTATKRWSMVQVSREQNIAEHMYLVAMTARAYAVALDLTPHRVHECVSWALVHDLSETVMGDVPTPTKRMINEAACTPPGYCLFEEAAKQLDGAYREMSNIVHDAGSNDAAIVRTIVKLADLTEAIRYLQYHGVGGHAKRVQLALANRFFELVSKGEPIIGDMDPVRDLYDELMTTSEFLTHHGDEYPI